MVLQIQYQTVSGLVMAAKFPIILISHNSAPGNDD